MLILASNSPRRKQLLALGGWEFAIQPAEIDEQPLPSESAQEYVQRLAREKALAVARSMAAREQQVDAVIAADTTVIDKEQILGKPVDAAEAERMLLRLRSRTHQVYTGIAVLRCKDGRLISELCATDVTMRNYSMSEISAYIASGDPLDKAGAYAIQHPGFHPVERVVGCYTNVVGLPLCRVFRQLSELEYPAPLRPDYPCLYLDQEVCSFSPGVG